MTDHGARDHATWSASATARNVQCPGALALSRFAPPEKESMHAARGTACHQIAEKCLRSGADPVSFLGSTESTKQHQIEIDEELAASAEMYVEYVRAAGSHAARTWIEQRFSLADLGPPFDAGGTGDAVIYHDATRMLEIVDLKNGMGVVDAKENPQLRTYGLGALLANAGLDVDTIKVTIVQPRAQHKDGRIRSETFHVADLLGWTADLLAAMHRSKTAADAYDAASGNSVLLDEWAAEWLRPGKCTFCPVEGSCPALRKRALKVAEAWVDPETDELKLGNSVLDQSPEALARDLDAIPMLEDWIKARRALAHAKAEQGETIPDYQLADRIGNRAWTDEQALLSAVVDAGIDRDDCFVEPKLKSPAQMEKLLGAKRKALIEPFTHRPVTGTNLVSVARTTRPAARPAAERFLDPS